MLELKRKNITAQNTVKVDKVIFIINSKSLVLLIEI